MGDGGNFSWFNVYKTSLLAAVLELDYAADLGEEGVVLATAYVCAGLERCAALTDDDAAAEDGLATEYLDSKPLGV